MNIAQPTTATPAKRRWFAHSRAVLGEQRRRFAARIGRGRGALLSVAIDVGTGPVVLLVHGIASSSTTFHHLVPKIEATHRVIAVDLLGFGTSAAPHDATFTVEEHAEALARTVSSLRLKEPFVLVGHSMGSLIASRYARDHESTVSRLILVSPPIYPPREALTARFARRAEANYFRLYEYLRANKERTLALAATVARLSPIPNLLVLNESNWNAFAMSLERSIMTQTAVDDIAGLSISVEIIYGTLDPFILPAGIKLVKSMPGVTIHRVDGGDHVVRKRMARVIAAAVA